MYYMKAFYEEWSPAFGGGNSAVAIAELPSEEILQSQLQKLELDRDEREPGRLEGTLGRSAGGLLPAAIIFTLQLAPQKESAFPHGREGTMMIAIDES